MILHVGTAGGLAGCGQIPKPENSHVAGRYSNIIYSVRADTLDYSCDRLSRVPHEV